MEGAKHPIFDGANKKIKELEAENEKLKQSKQDKKKAFMKICEQSFEDAAYCDCGNISWGDFKEEFDRLTKEPK